MTHEMRMLLAALEAERQDWIGMLDDAKGDEMSAMITLSCGAVLGGLHQRLTSMLSENRPGWQNVADIGNGRTLEDTE